MILHTDVPSKVWPRRGINSAKKFSAKSEMEIRVYTIICEANISSIIMTTFIHKIYKQYKHKSITDYIYLNKCFPKNDNTMYSAINHYNSNYTLTNQHFKQMLTMHIFYHHTTSLNVSTFNMVRQISSHKIMHQGETYNLHGLVR
jgi:hypothetical protein